MGNVESLAKSISDEYKRVRLDPANNVNNKRAYLGEGDYMVLDEVLQIQPPRETTIDICHLGTLFVIDKNLTGRFYEADILYFTRTYASQALGSSGKDDFQSKFQAYCTLKMWNKISEHDGATTFVEWFSKLFTESPNYIQSFPHHPNSVFLTSDAIKKMYQILSIKNYYGGDFRSFLDLMQRSAEEQSIMKLDEDELDDVVPLVILKNFSKDFINGFIKLMFELGFQENMLLE
ncbi:hypothetical protein CYY_006617 [Polysphondylium violaceum]|uniref:Uncharacterized protein n=1 Tax=Polysphondylium violaceum TaxID=133409 RepID=A0A8J4UY50_9MYCE|nr:hypothetical protein CYY_006617 [Polysphondylium violaceum]